MKSLFISMLLFVVLVLPFGSCSGDSGAGGNALEGTSWLLVTFRQSSLISGTTITLTFEEGQVGGNSGCNAYGGTYQVNGENLSMGALFMTEMACLEPEGVMDQESQYLSALGDAQTYRLTGASLTIFLQNGEKLVFEAAH